MSVHAPQPVVVTGLGAVSSIGIGVQAFRQGLREGRCGAKPIEAFDVSGFEYANGCEVTDFDPEQLLERLPVHEFGRASRFAAAAARMAVRDGGFTTEALRAAPGLVAVGTTDGESRDLDHLALVQVTEGPEHMRPEVARRVSAGRLSLAAARELRLENVEAVSVPTACAAGNYAIGYGLDALQAGDVDFALCGGADALCRKTFAGFYRLGTIAPERCQPFDAERRGILTGEGAGMLLLERLDAALARGAHIYAEVLGYGLNCDADHPVAPNEQSIARCMSLALADAEVRPSQIDLISAHGTGTKANDVTEVAAIRQVFGSCPPRTISVKSMLGHSMGAASALASVACALAIDEGFIPPTINHVTTDPACPIDCVPNQSVPAELNIVLNNALAFGGNNAVVVLARHRNGHRAGHVPSPVPFV